MSRKSWQSAIFSQQPAIETRIFHQIVNNEEMAKKTYNKTDG